MIDGALKDNAIKPDAEKAIAKAWKFPGIKEKIRSSRRHQLYGWQLYRLATTSTNPQLKDLDKTQFATNDLVLNELAKIQQTNGSFAQSEPEQAFKTCLALMALEGD